MAEQAEEPQGDDELDLNNLADDQELDAPEGEEDQDDDPPEGSADDDDEDEEVQISFAGEEAAPASQRERGSTSNLIRELRTKLRDAQDRAAKYERGEIQSPKPIEVGEKPTFEGCGFDEVAYETELEAWQDRKRQAEQAQSQANQEQEAVQAEWQGVLASHGQKIQALKARDYDDAKDVVEQTLGLHQQAALIMGAKNSALVVYALGKRPDKLAELAKIKNPLKFAAEIRELEGTLKVTKTSRRAPEPDRPQRGGAPMGGGTDKHLERLEREAERTGDRSKVAAYHYEQSRAAKNANQR